MKATLFSDGGSRGNPGPAAYGAVLFAEDGSVLNEVAAFIGIATNNVAEWRGVIAGMEAARDLGVTALTVRLDSELVVRQLTGVYKVKHPDMIPLHAKAKILMRAFAVLQIGHVPRAQNAHADALANAAMDAAAAKR